VLHCPPGYCQAIKIACKTSFIKSPESNIVTLVTEAAGTFRTPISLIRNGAAQAYKSNKPRQEIKMANAEKALKPDRGLKLPVTNY
jgi:hypothetical protein